MRRRIFMSGHPKQEPLLAEQGLAAAGQRHLLHAGPARVGRRCVVGLAGFEAVAAAAEDEFVATLEQCVPDANESAVGRIEIGEDPEWSALAARAAEFGVAGGHEYVVADAEVAVG